MHILVAQASLPQKERNELLLLLCEQNLFKPTIAKVLSTNCLDLHVHRRTFLQGRKALLGRKVATCPVARVPT